MKSIEELLESKNIIPERPPSLDAKGRRLDIFPAKVKGKFRFMRDIMYTLLLILFLIVPWTTFSGKQTILLDIFNKEFTFFGLTLLAHDGPLIFFVFGTLVFTLLLATALYGRIWCGWACPQTVFIDGLFRRIEEWIEGNHIKRKKLAEAAWSSDKFLKKTLKWSLFAIISSHIAHSFVAYFIGAKDLFWITLSPPQESLTLFIFLQVFTFIIAINFGWFKEQFCLVACPYGRFQSVLMDTKSKTVIYDYKRGEPRRENKSQPYADCVNCFKCVAVCPTGIDIRNGQQLECIACTSCIDACDSVMEKINKPKGLIRYASEEEIDNPETTKQLNIRALFYGAFLSFFVTSLTVFIVMRPDLSIKILRATEAPYTLLSDTMISNHFKIHVTNQTKELIQIQNFEVLNKDIEVVSPLIPLTIKAKKQTWIHIFLKVPIEKMTDDKMKVTWKINYEGKDLKLKKGVLSILGPSK